MATETITRLVDDLDGSKNAQKVEFSFMGTPYEIDLTDKHADQMRAALQPWLDKARRQRGMRGRRRSARAPRAAAVNGSAKAKPNVAEKKATNDEIRAWAKEHGLKVADKGRIPNSVIEQYQAS